MNKVGVYFNRDRDEQALVMNSICQSIGVASRNFPNVKYTDEFDVDDYEDIVVIFGQGSLERGKNARLKYDIIREVNSNPRKHFVIVELGHIDRENFWNVTLDGFGRQSFYLHPNISYTRYSELGFIPKPFEWKGNKIVICKQLARDMNVLPYFEDEREYEAFIIAIQKELMRRDEWAGYEIEVREHPRNKKPEKSLDSLLDEISLLVTWSSNSAIEAIMKGVPSVILSPNHLAYNLGNKLDDHKLPSFYAQCVIINRICHAQWSIEEMKSGKCWKHIEKVIDWRNGKK